MCLVPVGLTALAVALYANITRPPEVATVNAEPTAFMEAIVHNSGTNVVSRVNSSAAPRNNCIRIIQFFVTTHPVMHMLLDGKNNSPLALFWLGNYSSQHATGLLHVFLTEYQNAHHGLAMLMLDENHRIPLFSAIGRYKTAKPILRVLSLTLSTLEKLGVIWHATTSQLSSQAQQPAHAQAHMTPIYNNFVCEALVGISSHKGHCTQSLMLWMKNGFNKFELCKGILTYL